MGEYYWDEKIEYLMRTRSLYYNDDYLEFLVKSVWKINRPVKLIDYGCGYGYLGLKLMPLLPSGSMYTGLDKGEKLLDKARGIFSKLPYESRFIQCDLIDYVPDETYDIALSHAFLLHMSDPVKILSMMTNSLSSQGRIICFEPHWISCMSSYDLNGVEQSEIVKLGVLQKLFEQDVKRNGKDGNIGIKIPYYLSRLGYMEIDCRTSDKVVFLDPKTEGVDRQRLYESLVTDGFGSVPRNRYEVIDSLVDRGMSVTEAEEQYETELKLSKLFTREAVLTMSAGMKITTGIKNGGNRCDQ